jgi:hypothetical protein
MGDYGLKISRPGKDISSTTPEDFVFNSKNENNVKIVARDGDTATITTGNYKVDVSITHNLGFIPMVMLFVELTPASGRWYMGGSFTVDEGTYISMDGTETYVDDTYFKFSIHNMYGSAVGSNKTISYYYYIFGDSAN